MTVYEGFSVSGLLMILSVVLAAFLTNAGIYMRVERFDLLDARQGERVMLDYERTFLRDFDATWRLDLYRNGTWIEAAFAPNVHRYRTTAKLPPPEERDLSWLSYEDPDFADLECGDYEAVVRWTINPDSLLMRRRLEARAKFTVICHAD